ncbi:MAG: hypothetical protein ABIG66_05605 [Candidatus Kerfeldbacteria bacterium]
MRSLIIVVILISVGVTGAVAGYLYCETRQEDSRAEEETLQTQIEEEVVIQHDAVDFPNDPLFVGYDDQIWEVDIETGQRKYVSAGIDASISPDGKTLAFIIQMNNSQIDDRDEIGVYLYDIQTREKKLLRSYEAEDGIFSFYEAVCSVSWSPDGMHLVVDSGTSPYRRKIVLDIETGDEVITFNTYTYSFAWLNNNEIVFSPFQDTEEPRPYEPDQGTGVAVIDLQGNTHILRSASVTEGYHVMEVRDGRIYFRMDTVESNEQWGAEGQMVQTLKAMDADGGNEDIVKNYDSLRDLVRGKLPEMYQKMHIYDVDQSNNSGEWFSFVLNENGTTRLEDQVFVMNMEDPSVLLNLGDATHPAW